MPCSFNAKPINHCDLIRAEAIINQMYRSIMKATDDSDDLSYYVNLSLNGVVARNRLLCGED